MIEDASTRAQQRSNQIKYAKDIARYTIHGIIISLVMLAMNFSLPFVLVPYLFSDLPLSILFLFVICFIFVLLGILNASTTDYLWDKETSKHWVSLLGHGFLLSIGALLVLIGSLLLVIMVETTFPIISSVGAIPVIISMVLVNGLYGKNLANYVTHIGSLLRFKKTSRERQDSPSSSS